MAARSRNLRVAAATAGAAARWHKPEAEELQRDLAALRLEEHVRNTVAKFGPLSTEQRARLSVLLTADKGGDLSAA